MPTLTDSQRNKRATLRLMKKAGASGLSFKVDTRHRVAHVAIHDAEGTGTGLTFTEAEFDSLVEKMLQHVRGPEALPTIARLLRHAELWKSAEVQRLQGEAQTLRWRIMHLEREAEERMKTVYSDRTALMVLPTRATSTEREMTYRDDRGAMRVGLVDDEKGAALPLNEGGAS